MLMAVDIGNTQTVLGIFDGDELRARWRITTEANRTADEVGAVCSTLLGFAGMSTADIKATIVSSVVPTLTHSYEELAKSLFGSEFYEVNGDMKTGLDNRYDDPRSVGADRIVNAVATGKHYGFPAIIVDIGTATTVEAVDDKRCYLGGAILTGLNVALDALISKTSKLPSVDLNIDPPQAIATNTPDSIRSGFLYGYAGAIDSLVRRFRDEIGEPGLMAVSTGGPAEVIARHCREIGVFDPDLTLKGLRVLYEMNS